MKNKSILGLAQGLEACGKLKGVKFSYVVAKNNKMLQPILETLDETVRKIKLEYATKDEKGEPIVTDNKYKIEDTKGITKAFKELDEIETEVTLHKIKKDELPEDITAEQLTGIMEIVEE